MVDAVSRRRRLSTLRLEPPQTRTRWPAATECRMISTRVCVLPVPGGPHMRDTSGEESARTTAVRWEGFRWGL
jgi:hypothetical protein